MWACPRNPPCRPCPAGRVCDPGPPARLPQHAQLWRRGPHAAGSVACGLCRPWTLARSAVNAAQASKPLPSQRERAARPPSGGPLWQASQPLSWPFPPWLSPCVQHTELLDGGPGPWLRLCPYRGGGQPRMVLTDTASEPDTGTPTTSSCPPLLGARALPWPQVGAWSPLGLCLPGCLLGGLTHSSSFSSQSIHK